MAGGLNDVPGFDWFASGGEDLEEPAGAEPDLGRRGRRRLDVLGVAQSGDGQIVPLEDHAEGRRVTAEVGLDDLEAAHLAKAGWGLGLWLV